MKFSTRLMGIFGLTLVLIAITFLQTMAFAETIYFKDGKTLKGKVVEQSDAAVVIELYGSLVPCSMDEIEKIEGAGPPQKAQAVETSQSALSDGLPHFSISGDDFSFRGQSLGGPPQMAFFSERFGEASRVLDKKDRIIHIYDERGLIFFEEKATGSISSITFNMKRRKPDFWIRHVPDQVYQGDLMLNGNKVLPTHTIGDIQRFLPEVNFKQVSTMKWYKAVVGNMKLNVKWSKKGSDQMEFLDISFKVPQN